MSLQALRAPAIEINTAPALDAPANGEQGPALPRPLNQIVWGYYGTVLDTQTVIEDYVTNRHGKHLHVEFWYEKIAPVVALADRLEKGDLSLEYGLDQGAMRENVRRIAHTTYVVSPPRYLREGFEGHNRPDYKELNLAEHIHALFFYQDNPYLAQLIYKNPAREGPLKLIRDVFLRLNIFNPNETPCEYNGAFTGPAPQEVDRIDLGYQDGRVVELAHLPIPAQPVLALPPVAPLAAPAPIAPPAAPAPVSRSCTIL